MSRVLSEKSLEFFELFCSAALQDFCDGYRWMFEKELSSSLVSSETVAPDALESKGQEIIAINQIAYAGEAAGSGTFQIVLTKEALFTMGGITVMLPLPRIREDRRKGNEEDAKMLADAVGEVGNLLTGAFGKVFRDGVEDEEGLGDHLAMHLRLPILLGKVKVPPLEGVEKVHVLTYQIEPDELDPCQLKLVFPAG